MTEAAQQWPAQFQDSSWVFLLVLVEDSRAPHHVQKSGMPLDLDEYSETNLRNMEDLSSNNRAGVSNSATRPAKSQN